MHMNELTDTDYVVLEYINRFDSVSKEQIIKELSKKVDGIESRLEKLSYYKYDQSKMSFVNDSRYIIKETEPVHNPNYFTTYKDTNFYHISQLGKKELQDYKVKTKIYRKELWLKNAWIPLIVSFTYNLLIDDTKMLLSKILQWVSNFL